MDNWCSHPDAEDSVHCYHDREEGDLVCCWCGDLFENPDADLPHGPHAPKRDVSSSRSGGEKP
jgi:hypothetical protein